MGRPGRLALLLVGGMLAGMAALPTSCRPRDLEPSQVVQAVFGAHSLAQARPHLLKPEQGGPVKAREKTVFAGVPPIVVRTEEIDPARMAVWCRGVNVPGFIDPTGEAAVQVVMTTAGWKVDLAATLSDPGLRMIARQLQDRRTRLVKDAMTLIRREVRSYREVNGRWPEDLARLASWSRRHLTSMVGPYVIALAPPAQDAAAEPWVTARAPDPRMPAFRMSLSGDFQTQFPSPGGDPAP